MRAHHFEYGAPFSLRQRKDCNFHSYTTYIEPVHFLLKKFKFYFASYGFYGILNKLDELLLEHISSLGRMWPYLSPTLDGFW